jgi:putative transposase
LHIVQRGHNHHCKLHAYVLMTNHVHLLLTPKKAGLIPRFIMSIGCRYVQYINRTHGCTGTLWDSRYKSSVVHADSHLLTCQRYIELNPVRAAMVDDPAHYRWSGYQHNALGQPDARLSPHPVYTAMATSDKAGQAAYRALFRPELDADAIDDIRLALNSR